MVTPVEQVSPERPLRWGVLGAANIALRTVIPAINASGSGTVTAIASRDLAKATAAAQSLGIARAFGSYEELVKAEDIASIYNPLPNHLHVPWSIRAAEAGKHVLVEKPIALSAHEAQSLVDVAARTQRFIGEAFMVHSHPQWDVVQSLVRDGRIGELRVVTGHFSYFRIDPDDVRSHAEWGGGALMDIGCYPVTIARRLFGAEPTHVVGQLEVDPVLGVDRVDSVLMKFPGGQATFVCAGQLVPHQRLQVFGTTGRIEVAIPFNAPRGATTTIRIDDGRTLGAEGERLEIPAVDQYAEMANRFAEAVRGGRAYPVSLHDSIANMAVLDAIVRSTQTGAWERPFG